MIDGYIPGDKKYGFKFSGIEGSLKYNFLSAAKDPIGLSVYWAMEFSNLDPHSGQDKDIWHNEWKLLLQKYFLDDQLIVQDVEFLQDQASVDDPRAEIAQVADLLTAEADATESDVAHLVNRRRVRTGRC